MARLVITFEALRGLRDEGKIHFSHHDTAGEHFLALLVWDGTKPFFSDAVEKGQEGRLMVIHLRPMANEGGWLLTNVHWENDEPVYTMAPSFVEEALMNAIQSLTFKKKVRVA